MTLKEFYKEYYDLLIQRKEIIREKYKSSTKYTKEISYLMKNDILEKFNEESIKVLDYAEFFKIDHTFWQEKKVDSIEGTNIYDWNQIAVIEHENKPSDWTYEVAKLDFIKAPLKVVIGFRKKDYSYDEAIIKTQASYLKHLDSDEEFGVILMNSIYQEQNDPYDMRCYKILASRDIERIIL